MLLLFIIKCITQRKSCSTYYFDLYTLIVKTGDRKVLIHPKLEHCHSWPFWSWHQLLQNTGAECRWKLQIYIQQFRPPELIRRLVFLRRLLDPESRYIIYSIGRVGWDSYLCHRYVCLVVSISYFNCNYFMVSSGPRIDLENVPSGLITNTFKRQTSTSSFPHLEMHNVN